MKKITINPHNCTEEEYSELLTYLNEKYWDFSIENDQPENNSENKHIYILKHRIEYWYNNQDELIDENGKELEIFESDIEHIQNMIIENDCVQGELCGTYYNKNEKEIEYTGWWKIV